MVLGPKASDPLSRRVTKVSVGAVFKVPIFLMEDDAQGLEALKAHGYTLLAAVTDKDAAPLKQYRKTGKEAIVLGNEADGLPETLASLCDVPLTIPLAPNVDSLNVHVAAAVFLFYLQD